MSNYLEPWAVLAVAPRFAPVAGRVLAGALRASSARLERLARRLDAALAVRAAANPRGVVEYHAEAGAPEGALYVDGRLVGFLSGVNRL